LDVMGLSTRCSARIIIGVARRCSHGAPQVLLCEAEKKSQPFPTTFWLICPHLTRLAGQIESQNGVSLLEASLVGQEEVWRRYNLAHVRLRLNTISKVRKIFLRRYGRRRFDAIRLVGMGGIADFTRLCVKCIHLQIASYLGFGYHPALEWLCGVVSRWECDEGICAPLQSKLIEEG
jgi:hypothetical protein